MSKADKTNYQTLADFARIVGVDRTTVLDWVRKGKLKSKKKSNSKKHHKLLEYLFYGYTQETLRKCYGKPYPKYSNPWTETEIYVMINWTGTDEQLAKAIGRSVNAIRIKRTRLSPAYQRKNGNAKTKPD